MRFVRESRKLAVAVSMTIFIVGVFISFASFSVDAQDVSEKKIGRLPDGRAFRINEQGYQLVDQMAELEVTVDDLRKQVFALENELAQKNSNYERANLPKSADLKEQNLVRTSENGMSASKPSQQVSDLPLANTYLANCEASLKNLNLELSRMQLKLQQQAPASVGQAVECDYQSAKNPLWEANRELESQLAQAKRMVAMRDEQESMQNSTRAARDIEPSTRVNAEQDIKFARGALANPVSTKNTEPVKNVDMNTGSISLLKSELVAELKKIDTLIGERKSLLDVQKSRGRGVSVQMQQLVTSKGMSLDTLRISVSNLNSQSNAAEVKEGVGEIKTKLAEDIKVLQRLKNL